MDSSVLFVIITLYFILSVIFQIKHLVCDYFLQNKFMLGKFKDGWEWIIPLAAHCSVHAGFTFLILYLLCPWLSLLLIVFLSLVDYIIHFIMDRIKASPHMFGKFESLSKRDFESHKDVLHFWEEKSEEGKEWLDLLNKKWEKREKSNRAFWLTLGVDQTIHHLTHELVVYIAILAYIL